MEYIKEKKCVSCLSFSRIRITMHGSENVVYHCYTTGRAEARERKIAITAGHLSSSSSMRRGKQSLGKQIIGEYVMKLSAEN